MAGRETPRHRSTPVVADKMHPLSAASVDQCTDVVHKLGHSIVSPTTRPGARRIAALVGSQAPIPLCGKTRDDGVLSGVQLWTTMQQHYHRPVSRTFIDYIEDELIAAVLIHALRMDPPP